MHRFSRTSLAIPMSSGTLFSQRKQKVLEDLKRGINDKSLAGRVDRQVAPLVHFINENFSCYVTTSSCSGRVSLFHKGQLSTITTDSSPSVDGAAMTDRRAEAHNRKRGAFGRGALFQSHDPFPDVGKAAEQHLVPALEAFRAWRDKPPEFEGELNLVRRVHLDPLLHETELLELKFEPMIVHVQCETLDDAGRLLRCASESGQMESGVLSCSRGTSEQRKIICCITSPLRVALPLFAQGGWLLGHSRFDSAEWQSLITSTLRHMNVLFEVNERRRLRFADEVKKRLL